MFQLLETECHHLDMILAKDTSQPVLSQGGTTYNNYVKQFQEAERLKKEAQEQDICAQLMQEQLTWLLFDLHLSTARAADMKYEIMKVLDKASTLVITK